QDSRPVTVPWSLNVGCILFVSGRMCSFQLEMNCASLICSRYRSSVPTMGCASTRYGRASSDEVEGFPDLVRATTGNPKSPYSTCATCCGEFQLIDFPA